MLRCYDGALRLGMIRGALHARMDVWRSSRSSTRSQLFIHKTADAATVLGRLGDEGPVPELDGAIAWLNSAPATARSRRGKVVLFDICTYSCINSLRQLPYLKHWAAQYRDAGLVVIGVHSPEFTFEKEQANVERAVHDLNITYAVAIDCRRTIWNAFNSASFNSS